ncbi:MAG: hypothetical protein MUF83_00105 [Acidimicrobiales bacterium]|nr:hypothetical protein [Acidimicrobiales bacterium]
MNQHHDNLDPYTTETCTTPAPPTATPIAALRQRLAALASVAIIAGATGWALAGPLHTDPDTPAPAADTQTFSTDPCVEAVGIAHQRFVNLRDAQSAVASLEVSLAADGALVTPMLQRHDDLIADDATLGADWDAARDRCLAQ